MMRWKAGLFAATAAGLIAVAVAAPGSAKALKGQLPPDFTGTALDGRKIRLSDFRGKNPVVLNFYADFCAPCRKEFPRLKELDQTFGPKGLKIVSVSMDEERQTAAALPKETGVKFPVIFDPSGGIAEKYSVQAIPHTLVLDRDGKVHTEIIGLDLDLLDRAVNQVVR